MDAALREGCGIVVVGADSPLGKLPGRLAAFAQVARPGVHPGARVILTERTSGPANGYEAEGLPALVRVPSLAELRTELPDVVREVSAELFPGAPAPRFSPAALQCLLAWRWPGNAAKLARLLAGLRRSAASGLIQTKDRPAAMRQPSLSSLSRYEQSERDTIMAALAEADGNESRAAEILGIGRTTMYRKMRALKIADDERMVAPGA
jgi:transcriptional regulator with AAA-type ATPase domain